jgi:hypothetical protein
VCLVNITDITLEYLPVEPMGILRPTQGRGDIKTHPKGAQLGTQQEGTNSVAISIQGMPFGHHTMLLPNFLFPWSMRWYV